MNYRTEEVLAWFIPGFYTMSFLGAMLIINNWDEVAAFLQKSLDGKATNVSIIKDSFPLLLFVLPVAAMVIGWIVNAFGGWLFRIKWLNLPIASALDNVIGNNTLRVDNVDYNKQTKWRNKVSLFRKKVRLSINLERVDRFYYRYVLSRNMVGSQLLLIVIISILWIAQPTACWLCRYMPASLVLIVIYLQITWRDLTTHSKYVWKAYING